MDIKEYIKDIVREIISEDELEEMSTSGDAGAYSTPYAFRGNKKGENAATKAAISQGFKKASTALPKNSKIVDYKQLFEDEYEMNQDPKTKEFTKRVKLSDKDKETVKKIQALMAKQKSLKENIQNNFEVKVGDTLENIRTGVLTKIKSIKGNNITGVIIDLGDGLIGPTPKNASSSELKLLRIDTEESNCFVKSSTVLLTAEISFLL